MDSATLRSLARQYATGILNKENYRKSRGELIQKIVSGEIKVKAIDYLPPLVLEDDVTTETVQRDRTEMRPPSERAKSNENLPVIPDQPIVSKKPMPMGMMLLGGGLVLILIIGVVLFYPKPPGSETDNLAETSANATTESSQANSAAKAGMGEQLIADFLNSKDWKKENMDNFIAAWNALELEERAATANTKRMQRLSSTIYKQFLEAKALSGINSEQAIDKQTNLINFASAIGIVDNRMTLD